MGGALEYHLEADEVVDTDVESMASSDGESAGEEVAGEAVADGEVVCGEKGPALPGVAWQAGTQQLM